MLIPDTMIFLYIGLVGLFMGSFLNVLADRLSQERTILGRSKCDSCKQVLSWKDLIPLISFALLRAKCRYCKASLSYQYPLSELFTSVVFMLTYFFSVQAYTFTPVSVHIVHISIAAVLVVMLLADARYQIIPDEMQIVLFILAAVRLFLLTPSGFMISQLGSSFIAMLAVTAPLLLIFLLSKGRGMGFGDVKYAVSMGVLLGLWNGLIALYIAFVIGGIVGGMILLFRQGTMKSKIAFGPYLFFATYLMLFFENEVILLLSRMYGLL